MFDKKFIAKNRGERRRGNNTANECNTSSSSMQPVLLCLPSVIETHHINPLIGVYEEKKINHKALKFKARAWTGESDCHS